MPCVHHGNPYPKATYFPIRPYSLKELSVLFGISARKFNNWLKPFEERIDKRIENFYTIPQLGLIFGYLDFPSVMYAKE